MFNSNASSAAGDANYIEDVFSTYLYVGNGATQTITNGIDLAGKGGLLWTKTRTSGYSHQLYNSAVGLNQYLVSNSTAANAATSGIAFNANGFTLGSNDNSNSTGDNGVSWTFREQAKFFDVLTYTGDGSNRTIAHNLGSAPGCMIVKCTSNAVGWNVYHRSLTSAAYQLELNTTSAEFSDPTVWNSTAPTSTEFSVGTNLGINGSGRTYVAYLFAHDAGGFGLTGTDNVISCGSYTGNGSTTGPVVTLGYEPQWLLVKRASAGSNDWILFDNMRGMPVGSADSFLRPNTTQAEDSLTDYLSPTATGFDVVSASSNVNTSSNTYIYIAIRRGPMKVPTLGTSVFSPNSQTASTGTAITTNFPPDLQLYRSTSQVANEGVVVDRLRGVNTTTTANSTPWLDTTTTAAEATATSVTRNWGSTGFEMPGFVATIPSIFWSFRRAPSFFDEVCYTGTGVARNVSHNLTVVPELIIFKARNTGTDNWIVYAAPLGPTKGLYLNATNAAITSAGVVNDTAPTASVFTTSTAAFTNINTTTYVAYLFATCAGVSKVGSYTGTAATQIINCGFTAGARFVLIKRTDSTGDWYVWDSARGIVAGNDPYLLLNTTAAEVTGTDYVDTAASGFELSSTAPAAINASGGTYIFLAIA